MPTGDPHDGEFVHSVVRREPNDAERAGFARVCEVAAQHACSVTWGWTPHVMFGDRSLGLPRYRAATHDEPHAFEVGSVPATLREPDHSRPRSKQLAEVEVGWSLRVVAGDAESLEACAEALRAAGLMDSPRRSQ